MATVHIIIQSLQISVDLIKQVPQDVLNALKYMQM